MKLKFILFFLILGLANNSFSQNPEGFDKMAKEMADKTVPLINYKQVNKLTTDNKQIVFLDARELIEFEISHIKNAINIGYDKFDANKIKHISKNNIVVVYCSVGYRSGVIGKKLRKLGFTSVFNLYGGLFDWVNNGNPVYSKSKKVTKVHPYNSKWGKWLNTEFHSN